MRSYMEKFVVLPFTTGCASLSSVALGTDQPQRPKPQLHPHLPRTQERDESSSALRMKSSIGFLVLPKSNITSGLHKLIRSLKSFSQLFVYKKEVDEKEREMEIGHPTDVKHVTHIGLDGSTTTNHNVKGWEDLHAPELLSNFPSISLRQFELAMSAQTHDSLLDLKIPSNLKV